MTKFLSALVLCLVAVPQLAHAVTFVVRDGCSINAWREADTAYAGNTIYEATIKAFQKHGVEFKVNEASSYVDTINGLGEKNEVAEGQVRAWGWNVRLNDNDLKEAPKDVDLPANKKNIVQWIYGYILMDTSKTGCADDCSFHPSTMSDCPANQSKPAPAPEESQETAELPLEGN